MTFPETSNPFKNGAIRGTQVLPSAYHKAEYRRGDPAFVMSRGELMNFAECPARWLAGSHSGETRATEWGQLMDGLVTLPEDQFEQLIAVAAETYPAPKTCTAVKRGEVAEGDPIPWNSNATFCDEWERRQGGRLIVKWATFAKAREAVKRLLAEEHIAGIIQTAAKQVHVTAEYHDRATGIVVPFKILVDLVPPPDDPLFGKSLIDFKTCADAGLRKWQRDVAEYNYHVQGAVYLDVFNAVEGEDRCDFRHILSESAAPYQPGKRLLDNEFIQLGRMTYTQALARYCECLSTGRWPGYEGANHIDGFEFVNPEAWMLTNL